MSDEALFRGVYPAIVSPVDSSGEVLESPLRMLVRHLSSKPVRGLYVCGGTGEGVLLSSGVRKRILDIVIDEVRDLQLSRPFQVIVHIGAAEAANTEELVAHANAVGADAISSIPPLYYAYSRERIRQYYGWISGLSGLPLIIYASAQAGVDFTADMLRDLLVFPTIQGLKYTGSGFYELMRMREVVPPGFSILSGADEQLMLSLLAGADGGVGATYNVMPESFSRLYEAWCRKDPCAMQDLQRRINSVIDVIVRYPVIAAVKAMLEHQGFAVGEPVFPNDILSGTQRESLIEQLRKAGWEEEML